VFKQAKIASMKKVIVSLLLLVFVIQSFGQVEPLTKDEYLQRSKNQRTAGWILLAGGTTMAVTGIALISNADFWSSEDNASFDAGGFLLLGGVLADLTSIPFFISSATNARRAAAISFKNQKLLVPTNNAFVWKYQPAISLKIELRAHNKQFQAVL
jgi:hypothetical protein